MKKCVFILSMGVALILLTSFALSPSSIPAKKSIDITLTSGEGCTVHIVGTVSFRVIPLEITNFTGTVSMSGPGDCPNGTLTFSNQAIDDPDILAALNSLNPCQATQVNWSYNASWNRILNSPEVNNAVVEEINSICPG